MSNEAARESGAAAATSATRRARSATAPPGRKRPAGRAVRSARAEVRDWADTGDSHDEADSAGDSVGAVKGAPAAPEGAAPEVTAPEVTAPEVTAPEVTAPEAGPVRRRSTARRAAPSAEDEKTVQLARPDLAELPVDGPPVGVQGIDEQPAVGAARTARATGAPRRPPMLVQGLWPALLAGALSLSASFGLFPLAAAVLGVQVFLILGALALLDAPASGGAFLVAGAAVIAADAVVLLDDGSISGLAGVAGVGLVGSLVHQLARRGRSRVTESLADTLVVLVVSVAAACLLALHAVDGGETVLQASFAAAGAVLLAGRVGDWLVSRPTLAVGSTRGWPGLLLGLAAGVGTAVLVADLAGEPPMRAAVLLGLVVASTVATADLAVDLGAAELRSGWRDARRVAALRPTSLLLPYAVLGPVALLAGRLLLT